MTPSVMLTPYNKYIHNQAHMTFSSYQTQIEDTTYNGWTNYETWNVALWLGNDEGMYSLARRATSYDELIPTLENIYGQITPDGVRWMDPSINTCEMDEMLDEM